MSSKSENLFTAYQTTWLWKHHRRKLLTHNRCASHLLERMLSKQPNTTLQSEFFHAERLLRRKMIKAGPIESVDTAMREDFLHSVTCSYSVLLHFLDDAGRHGKIAVAHTQPHLMISPQVSSDFIYGKRGKPNFGDPGIFRAGDGTGTDHADPHTNPTVVPDSILLRPGTIPIINFRHTMLVCDGLYRGLRYLPVASEPDGDFKPFMPQGASLYVPRLMYDWYIKQGITPILLDADDYIGPEKESLMQQVCARIPGFDSGSVIYSWPAASKEDLSAMSDAQRQIHQTLLGSTGVKIGYDTRGRSIESEHAKWVDKYGQEEAEFFCGLVEDAMPNYEYLRARRLRPDGTIS